AAKILELEMITVKSLAIVALLVGGTSLAIAQNGPSTGGQPPVAGGAAGNPAAPGPQAGTKSHHATAHHKKMHTSAKSGNRKNMHMSANRKNHKNMYMSAGSRHHKPLKTGKPQPKQPQ
ncbi:MAG: hypothetical protein ACTHJS_14145, partial [Xanthobacteraceae bacterium]